VDRWCSTSRSTLCVGIKVDHHKGKGSHVEEQKGEAVKREGSKRATKLPIHHDGFLDQLHISLLLGGKASLCAHSGSESVFFLDLGQSFSQPKTHSLLFKEIIVSSHKNHLVPRNSAEMSLRQSPKKTSGEKKNQTFMPASRKDCTT